MTLCDNREEEGTSFSQEKHIPMVTVNTVHLSRLDQVSLKQEKEEDRGRRRKRGWSVSKSSLGLVLDQYGIPGLKEYRVPWFNKTFRNRLLLLHTSKDNMKLVQF